MMNTASNGACSRAGDLEQSLLKVQAELESLPEQRLQHVKTTEASPNGGQPAVANRERIPSGLAAWRAGGPPIVSAGPVDPFRKPKPLCCHFILY